MRFQIPRVASLEGGACERCDRRVPRRVRVRIGTWESACCARCAAELRRAYGVEERA